jgi:uncharacterized protein (DUF2384 family)
MASSPQFESRKKPAGTPVSVSPSSVEKDDQATRTKLEMMRYRTLVARTVDAFGDEIKASRWLSLANRDFDGKTPLQVAQMNGYDLKAIEPILIRIEHGVEF